MRKIVIVCGLIAGSIVTAMMVMTVAACYKNENFDGSEALGYATMVIAFSMIFVGIKTYRDKHSNGVISFGKAFRIGLYISLIASTLYVVVWLVDYYMFVPDFMDKYAEHVMREAKADGATQAEMDSQLKQMETYKDLYKNPLMVILMTYAEILPVGLIISLISALILKRKTKPRIEAA
jgi:amino acid transporter